LRSEAFNGLAAASVNRRRHAALKQRTVVNELFSIGDDVANVGVAGRDDVVVLVASGELDYGAAPQFRGCILGHIGTGWRHLVLDLSAVTFIDSTAIGVLMGAVARLQDAGGGSLSVVCAEENERVLRIFDIAGVADAIALHRSRAQAFAALTVAWPVQAPIWVGRATVSASGGELRSYRRLSRLGAVRKYALAVAAAFAGQPDSADGGDIGRGVDELA
jgi:anti-anti-sigma factor